MNASTYQPSIPTGEGEQRVLGGLDIGDIACFVIPSLSFVQFAWGGQIYGPDVLLLMAMPFVLARRFHDLQKRQLRITLGLASLWLISQIVTDLMRNSAEEDFFRGWAKILFTILHFITISLLIRDSIKRVVCYGLGVVAGGTLTFLITPDNLMAIDPWKFGLSAPVTILICLLASGVAKRSPLLGSLMMAGAGVLNLERGFRSMSLVCLTAAVYSYVQLSPRLSGHHGWSAKKTLTLCLTFGVGAWSALTLYAYAAQSGWLGAEALQKYNNQSKGQGGLLLGGRSDFIGATAAIKDSPVLGHGSWARDARYGEIEVQAQIDRGYRVSSRQFHRGDWDVIPSHSHLLGAWVESGFLGAVFWGWVLFITVTSLMRAGKSVPALPFFSFVAILLAWDILFSPYGAERRFTTPFYIYMMVMLGSFRLSRIPPRLYMRPQRVVTLVRRRTATMA